MIEIETVLKICGTISAVAGTFAILYKIYRYWHPAIVSVSYTLHLTRDKSDSIAITITNRSNVPIYIQSCRLRCTYSTLALVIRHLRQPFLRPSLYPNLRYNSCIYKFIDTEPVKLDPSQQKTFVKIIYEHPLNALYGPMLIASIQLTTGRIIRSKKISSPTVWKKIGNRGKTV